MQARLLGLAVVAAGLLDIASRALPGRGPTLRFLETAVVPAVPSSATGATAILGLILVILGRGLMQRRSFALPPVLLVLALSAATHLVGGFDVGGAAIAIGLALLLIAGRRSFAEGSGGRRVARPTAAVVTVEFVYGFAGLLSHHHLVTPAPTLLTAVVHVAAGLLGVDGPLRIGGSFGAWFPASLTVLGGMTIGWILLVALAPTPDVEASSSLEREHVRRLTEREDGDTLDPFVLRRDKQYVFSDGGDAVLGYRYVIGVGLASGDPVGDPDEYDDAVARYIDRCEQNGWRVGVLGVRVDNVPLYRRHGLKALHAGDEAVIRVGDFTLNGRAMRNVRQAVSHTHRARVTTEVLREGDLDSELRRALVGIAERWRGGAREHGFSMALDGLLTGRESGCVIVVCRDEDRRPIAFQRYVPCRLGRSLSMDAMRRDRSAPNGVNERMIVDVIMWAREHGVEELSLNFAGFREMMERGPHLTRAQKAAGWLIRRLSFNVQIETLCRFNGKFRPRWVPRYVVFRSWGDLPAILVAVLSAEGYLPFDSRRAGAPDVWAEQPVPIAALD
jgi:lysyl-tRNA synthetase class 2